MPLLFSLTQCGLSDLKAAEVCQKQAEAVPEKPATSRLFNACQKATVLPAEAGTPPLQERACSRATSAAIFQADPARSHRKVLHATHRHRRLEALEPERVGQHEDAGKRHRGRRKDR